MRTLELEYIVSEFQTEYPTQLKTEWLTVRRMISFYCGYKHNINEGEFIYLQYTSKW